MRQYLFRGIRVDNGEWVEGYYVKAQKLNGDGYEYFIIEEASDGRSHLVVPESVGQYTGYNEFVMTDKSFNKPLFEGDIVEVWNYRTLYDTKSQYDGRVKVRGVIRYVDNHWEVDLENEYNKAICAPKGSEKYERYLYYKRPLEHPCNKDNEDWYREHNTHNLYRDIVKIGTEFENSKLLEG